LNELGQVERGLIENLRHDYRADAGRTVRRTKGWRSHRGKERLVESRPNDGCAPKRNARLTRAKRHEFSKPSQRAGSIGRAQNRFVAIGTEGEGIWAAVEL